jgi:uncharacterized protein (TIGR02246 family)
MTDAADREAIHELIARYCLAFDEADAPGWAGCYTEDGEFDGAGQLLRGRPAMEAFLNGIGPSDLHRLTTNHIIDLDGDTARCRSSVVLLSKGVIVSSGRVADELRRVDGRWLIHRRAYTSDARPS